MENSRTRATRTFIIASSLLLFALGLTSGCSDSAELPQTSGARGGSAGASSGGGGSSSTAGSTSTAGTGAGLAGSAGSSAGSGGSGGSAGSAGSGGSAGTAVCLPDDECCDDPNKTAPGECGCGVPDTDTDLDGELNCNEQCPNDPDKTEPGQCGCGNRENDSDDDGIIDCVPGHYFEAEDGELSEVDVPFVVLGEGGAGGAAGAGGGGAADLPTSFTLGEDADASNMQYIESPAGIVADTQAGPARASYEFEIFVPDSYVFWGRFYTPDRDHNRLWVQVDDGAWTKLRVTTGEAWFWYTFHQEGQFATPISYELTEGLHTLNVASDTDGVRIDRFYVTPGSDTPAGNATTCNPPHTIQVGDACQSSCGMLQGNSCDPVMCEGLTPLPAYDCEICCKLP